MARPLLPVTDAGRAAFALAERHRGSFGERSAAWDSARRFPTEAVAEMRASGLAAAPVPVPLGGGGVDQLRDVMALTACLAAGDSSLGICSNMHLSFCWSLAGAARAGNTGAAALLREVGRGRVWFSAAVTEAGTNYFHCRTTLTADGDGWVLDGDKVFATGSPAATHFSVNARVVGGDHDGSLATAVVPAPTSGVEVVDDWDGMGMRASGSGQVRFRAVRLDADTLVLPGGPWGRFSAASLQGRAFGNVGNLAAIGGVAEAARDVVVARIRSQGRVSEAPLALRATVRQSLGELEADLGGLRAVLRELGEEADLRAANRTADLAEAHRFMAAFQSAKVLVNRLSQQVVDRSLDLAGGAGYRDGNAASRRYRDVRAGAFMQPFSPHESLGYLGAVAAGTEPDPEA